MAGLGLCMLLSAAVLQAGGRDIEVGVLVPVLRLTEHEGNDVGFGGRLGYDVNRHLALEGELNLFSRELTRTPSHPTVGMSTDRRMQGLFGVKAGMRWEKVGLFVKARPGFVNFRNQLHVVCIAAPCPPLSSSQTELALDLGAVLSFYPSSRLVVRVDVGDLWIDGTGNDATPVAGSLGHSFQWSTGLGIRF